MRQQGGFFYCLKIIIILAGAGAGFFCGEKVRASQNILINEALIYPPENRFIELYNPNNFLIDLSGWYLQRKTSTGASFGSLVSKTYFDGKTIGANGYLLISRASMVNADIIYSSLTLSDLNTVQLKNSNQEVVDLTEWGVAPDDGKSLERKADGSWQTGQNIGGTPRAANILPQPSPLQGEENSPALPGEQDETASSTEETVNPLLKEGRINKLGDIVINELVSDPADNEVEWVEILNKSGEEINLSGWRLEDGNKTKTSLTGIIGASGTGRYKVVEKPAGNLNNAGDLITLYDAGGKIIDLTAYGSWADGNAADNAPAAQDPKSLARKFDGYNTYNNSNDFAVTLKITKGAANIIEGEAEINSASKAGFDFSNDIYLSEILPNPTGDDTKLEFIEIHNAGNREVNLTGWNLSREDDKKINLEKIFINPIIKAKGYLAVYRPQSKLVLHNDRGEVKLFQPLADKPFSAVEYKEAKEGWSYNLENNQTPLNFPSSGGIWEWSEAVTPGAANVNKVSNHSPEVEFNPPAEILAGSPIIFDCSDTFDQDNDKLVYAWDFGDGFKNNLANPQHTYFKSGIYEVKLEVSDRQASSTKVKSLKVAGNIGELEAGENANTISLSPSLPGGIIINEFMPDPEGADTGNEWLELKNESVGRINLINWRAENGNGKYKFKDDLWLEAGEFYLLNNAISKLAFKNSDDVISLYDDNGGLAGRVEYVEAAEGEAYARGANDNWFWTTAITPGEENIISLAGSKSGIVNNESGIIRNINVYVATDLEKAREMETGSLVKVKGTVAVVPGILGVQIFYIVGSPAAASDVVTASVSQDAMAGKPGLQIYNYKKDFPELKVGDYVEVSGELTQTQGELRLKTKDKNDIKLIEHKSAPAALALSCDQINEEAVGRLITVTGEITDKNSSTLYLDDGNDEILVYLKKATGIEIKTIDPGQIVAITGILSRSQTGLRLLPRGPQDIIKLNAINNLQPQVLGETIEAAEWELRARDKKLELFKYLLIITGGIIAVLAGLFIKAQRKV